MDVFDNVDAEAVSRDCHEHLAGALPPGQVVRRTPGRDGAEEQLQVILLRQFFSRRHETAQLHQDLRGEGTKE